MTDIQTLLEELAGDDAPPSRLEAKPIYLKGRRRHRRRQAIAVIGSAGAVAAVIVTTVAATNGAPAPRPGPSTLASPPSLGERILLARAGDANHLYAVVGNCPPDDDNCPDRLLASEDGGRTWTERRRSTTAESFGVHGPTTLDLWTSSGNDLVQKVSTDGGRTFRTVTRSTTPISEVPENGWLTNDIRSNGPMLLAAVDPKNAVRAPLANQPNVTPLIVPSIYTPMWFSGWADAQAAGAVTLDRGRTWSTHVFSDVPPTPLGFRGYAASTDGRTIFLVYYASRPNGETPAVIYRSLDRGVTWQRRGSSGRAPGLAFDTSAIGWVAGDGRHFLVVGPPNGEAQLWVSQDGGDSYQPTEPSGLPLDIESVGQDTSGTGLLAYDGNGIYRSADGLTWSKIATS
jgi:hypothetical protein